MADIWWDRIEPHTRDPNIEEGLGARIADPLWMLARQWQVGEFRGEDAASPIDMKVRVRHQPIVSFRNEAGANGKTRQAEPFASRRPLESRVEAERVPSQRGRFSFAAEAGLDFLRRLDAARLQGLRADLRNHYALQVEKEELHGLPPAEQMRVSLLVRRALDGLRLLQATEDEVSNVLPASVRDSALAVWRHWRDVQQHRFDQPGPSGETWIADRLEHRFSIATTSEEKGSIVLTADQYAGGRLDWYSFNIDPKATPHAMKTSPATGRGQVQEFTTLAVPMTYSGMPTSRYWEFEEGAIYFGGIEAGPTDIGRLLVAEFATCFSDDWFLIPVRLPIGSVARVEQVSVRTTFGERHRVRSCAQWDHERVDGGERMFGLFELSGDVSAATRNSPWLALVPSLASTLHSAPLEAVSFVRDEAANVAWAIEERIETATGRSIPRRLLSSAVQPSDSAADVSADTSPDDAGDSETDEAWRYRLQTTVPPYWIPLIPERPDASSAAVWLRRARMLAWSELDDPRVAGPKGSLLRPTELFTLFEEEIPRGGVQVTRQWQVARGPGGDLHLWLSRRKRPGRGERGSGLDFDRTIRK